MNTTKSINFNFKQGIAWIVMILLLATPLLRFSWDIGPKTLINVLTLASILVILNTYKLTFQRNSLVFSISFIFIVCFSSIYNSKTSFLQSDALIIIDCVFLAYITASISKYYKQTLLIIPILVGSLISLIVLLRYFLTSIHFDGNTTGLAEMFVNVNVIAGYLLMALTLSFVIWRQSKTLGIPVSFLIYCGLLATGSRSAIVIGTIAIIVIIYSSIYAYSRLLITLFSILMVVAVSCVFVQLKPNLLHSLSNRIDWIKTAISMFAQSPIFGVGWGNYGNYYTVYKTGQGVNSLYAHNIIFQLLAESGILGLASFALMIISFIRQIDMKHFREEQNLYLPIIVSVLAFLCFNIFDYGFYIPALTVLFFFLLGTTVNMHITPKHSSTTAKLFSVLIFIVFTFILSTPLISSILFEHSKYYLLNNEYLLAQQYAERSILYNKSNWESYTKLAEIHFVNYTHNKNTDDLQEAISDQLKAIDHFPKNPALHSDLAWLYLSADKRDNAVSEITQAIRLDRFNDKYENTLMLFENGKRH